MPPKRNKFVNVQGANREVMLPGRHKCECQAYIHELVNNCLSCGRIVCQQEGSGPCYFCNTMVMSKVDYFKYLDGNKKILEKYSKKKPVMVEIDKDKAAAAIAQKDKLLEFDKTSAKRTKVIDDQADYFSADSPWLSKEEREFLEAKKKAYLESKNRQKRKIKVSFDFAGRTVIEQAETFDDNIEEQLSNLRLKSQDTKKEKEPPCFIIDPKFVGTLSHSVDSKESRNYSKAVWSNRIQDPELQEIVDSGHCLSVRQPYASLIMDGVKTCEGRSWYTPLRGRLWICAGNKPPSDAVIEEVRKVYKLNGSDKPFPASFPTGVLLGYVNLQDCIPQEEYLEIYPNGEIADSYVWVLTKPQVLPVKLPMQPKPKLFKLDRNIHQAARKIS